MNYDPNLTLCGKMAKQVVELTFQAWDCKKTVSIEVSGNCTGLSVIEAAVENYFCDLDCNADAVGGYPSITLEGPDTLLECCDEDGRAEEWLMDMLVKAEIMSIEAESK